MSNKFFQWFIIIVMLPVFSVVVFDTLFTSNNESVILKCFLTKDKIDKIEKYKIGQLIVMKVDNKICQIIKVLPQRPFNYLVRCPGNNVAYNTETMWISDFEIERGYE